MGTLGSTDGEFAGYRIERVLGRGGMGVVHLAEHVRLKRKVALKMLSPELAQDERFRERFIRESEIAASLDDPNVIPIYEAGEQDGVLFIAMRYVDGRDLKTLLEREGPLEPERVASIVDQVASALDAAHGKGLVHRDIKPANILVAPRGGDSAPSEHAYLTDFGLTKRAASDSGLTGTGVFVGSLNYAAPEQFEGTPLDGRTDVYSLGCVLFECLTGLPPFRKEQDVAMMHAHLHEPPPSARALRPSLAQATDSVIERAMAKHARDRYPTAGALSAALGDALSGSQQRRPGRSRPRPIRLLAVVGAVAAAIAVAVAALSREDVGSSPSPTPSASGVVSGEAPPPGSLNRIDPMTGTVTVTVPGVTGLRADAVVDPSIAVGEGGTWALTWALNSRPYLTAIEETTGAVRDRIAVSPTSFGGMALAVADRTVWFTGGVETGSVSRINPGTLGPLPPVLVEGGEVSDLVLGGEILWVGSGAGSLTAYDALTGDALMQVELGASPDELAFGAGSLWALDQLGNQVVQIDPADGAIVRRIDVSGNLEDVAAGDGGVWILDDLAGTVVQIDPDTGAVGDPVRVGPEPSAIAVGLGTAWIADQQDGRIYRVDPQTGAGEPIEVGAPLVAVAVDESSDSLWIAVLDPAT